MMNVTVWHDDIEVELELPSHYEVCPRCRGKGSHVNPAIDGHGITMEEWDRDWSEEDKELYLSGFYDVSCYECNGKRVVDVVDESLLDNSENYFDGEDDIRPATLRELWERHCERELEEARTRASELRFGY